MPGGEGVVGSLSACSGDIGSVPVQEDPTSYEAAKLCAEQLGLRLEPIG